jgi:hypothetical protein
MKRIPLTQGQFALVDDDDFERVNQYKWQAQWSPHTHSFSAVRRDYKDDPKRVEMNRFILNAPPDKKVDHRNRDRLDNRKENLRACTSSQNNANAGKYRNSASRFKGVTLDKRTSRWRARIQIDGKSITLGTYITEEEAARVYDAKARKLFGEFACTNEDLGLLSPGNDAAEPRLRRDKTTSSYRGVSWDAHRQCWVANITRNKNHTFVGRFSSEIDAARAYDAKARELLGESARLNFSEEP